MRALKNEPALCAFELFFAHQSKAAMAQIDERNKVLFDPVFTYRLSTLLP
jgi:hypothetical protein